MSVDTQGGVRSRSGTRVVLAVQRTSWAPPACLETVAATAALSGASVFRRRTGIVVIVRAPTEGEATAAASALARELAAIGPGIVVGMSAPAGADIEAASEEAGQAVVLAHCCPRVPTTLSDCPAETALSRDPAALEQAGDRLGALAAHPELIATLEAYFVHDGDRRATASALAIQIRTLDYRLRRAEELTGLSARRAHDSRTLVAGLAGRRLLVGGRQRAVAVH